MWSKVDFHLGRILRRALCELRSCWTWMHFVDSGWHLKVFEYIFFGWEVVWLKGLIDQNRCKTFHVYRNKVAFRQIGSLIKALFLVKLIYVCMSKDRTFCPQIHLMLKIKEALFQQQVNQRTWFFFKVSTSLKLYGVKEKEKLTAVLLKSQSGRYVRAVWHADSLA